MLEAWQTEMGKNALKALGDAKIIADPDTWVPKLEDVVPNWLNFEINKRLMDAIHTALTEINGVPVTSSTAPPLITTTETYLGIFIATAYDLSIQCCGKRSTDKNYGITASGYSLRGLSREQAMVIATNSSYAFGTKFRLEFDAPDNKYNGIYIVRDRGGAIKGNKLDVFFGDFNKDKADQSTINFGVKNCRVYLIK
jgi:3D (Asp-Asp-Asp) domain-containing protein